MYIYLDLGSNVKMLPEQQVDIVESQQQNVHL